MCWLGELGRLTHLCKLPTWANRLSQRRAQESNADGTSCWNPRPASCYSGLDCYTQMKVCGLVVDRKMSRHSPGKLPPLCFSLVPSEWQTQHRLLWLWSRHQKPGHQERRLCVKMLRRAGSWTELPELQEIEASQEGWGRFQPHHWTTRSTATPGQNNNFLANHMIFCFILSFLI